MTNIILLSETKLCDLKKNIRVFEVKNWHSLQLASKVCGFALVDPFIVSKMTLHGLIN